MFSMTTSAFLDAIKRIMLLRVDAQPLMAIFEDLHWIDTETRALLHLLADSIATAKVLLLVNYLPEYPISCLIALTMSAGRRRADTLRA